MNQPSSQTWRDGLQTVHDESGGAMLVEVVQPQDMPTILAAALTGNTEAIHVLRAVHTVIDGIKKAPKRRPMLCASCPRHLRTGPYSIVAAFPARDDPSRALTLAVCSTCATVREQVMEKAVVGLRNTWPDLRPIERPHYKGGHA